MAMVIAISPYISFYFLRTVAPKISVSKDRHKRPGGGLTMERLPAVFSIPEPQTRSQLGLLYTKATE